jgi:hypothetical protein
MNGSESRIEIFKPFGEAWELMQKILFQPFDIKKWLVIGFTAWLAHFGGGFNFSYNINQQSEVGELKNTLNQIPHEILIIGAIVLALVGVILVVVFAWLRSRGRFMFIDCIVKNRGAVVEPWREFRLEGNSYFFFSLLIGFAFWIFAAVISLPVIVFAIRSRFYFSIRRDQIAGYFIPIIIAWVFLVLLFVMAWALVANFMVPVMYRRRCRAYEAFRSATRLITAQPGEIVFYCLFWIVLAIGTTLIGCLAICFTCCIAAIPYIGTVILLPIYVVLRSFSLSFLRQFGPEYDVWATIPEAPPPLPPAIS